MTNLEIIWNAAVTLLVAFWALRIVLGAWYGLRLHKEYDYKVDNWKFMDAVLVGPGFWIGLVVADGIRWVWNKIVVGV